jgi:superfamily II DNA/RNA helicase
MAIRPTGAPSRAVTKPRTSGGTKTRVKRVSNWDSTGAETGKTFKGSAKSSKSAPKSFKVDGTPKKRWTSDERAERGHGARRRGGQTATARAERPYSSDRTFPSNRSERPFRAERIERSESPFRPEPSERPTGAGRGERSFHSSRPERNGRPERVDRPFRAERPGPGERPARSFDSDRPARSYDSDRPARSSGSDRSTRSYDSDRPARPTRSYDNDRPTRSYDNDRPARSYDTDRPARSFNSDRPARSYGSDRSERGSRPDRGSSDRLDHRAPRERGGEATGSDNMSWTAQEISADRLAPIAGGNGFATLGLPKALVSALQAGGITDPFPIQAATIPDALTGRDVLGRGQTGSGKTLGFGLPMITQLAGAKTKTPRGIVLVPTRELALQVADVLAPLAQIMELSVTLIAGGMSYTPQLRAFERGVDIVVATPGRLIDLLEQGAVDLSRVEVAVLDEADHMADLGFMPAVTTILDAVPAGGQRMLFSATLDGAVDRLVKKYLVDPVTHEVDSAQASVTTMVHRLIHILPHDKNALTAEIAGREGRTLVFVRTQRGADRVAEQLRDNGVMAGALHGGLTQGARTRILAAFKDGQVPVLVATDVAARGIHVDEVGLVLQVDPPAGPKEYLHRAGRTARAGGTGVVVTLALPHQRKELSRLTSQAGVQSIPLEARPGDATLAEATGARQPSGGVVTQGEFERLIAPPTRGSGRPRQHKNFSRRDSGRGFDGRSQGGRRRG